VVRVEWWIDGIRRVNDTAAPYRQNYSVPSSIGPGQHTVQARAYDAQGLVGLSQTVTVTRVKNNSSSTTYTATRTLSSKAKAKRSCRVSRKQVRRLSARSAAAKRRACRRAAANRRRS
jgi:hypothetical protein